MTQEQLKKLPKWAQEKLTTLQRQRDTAVRALVDWEDKQTVPSFFIDEMICDGEQCGPSTRRRYIEGTRVSCEWEGVSLDITLRKGEGISLKWNKAKQLHGRIAMVPRSYQHVTLETTEKPEVTYVAPQHVSDR